MARHTMFYGTEMYSEHLDWPKLAPYGAYIRVEYSIAFSPDWVQSIHIKWYRVITVKQATPINQSDIPAKIKMLCLTLNIPI